MHPLFPQTQPHLTHHALPLPTSPTLSSDQTLLKQILNTIRENVADAEFYCSRIERHGLFNLRRRTVKFRGRATAKLLTTYDGKVYGIQISVPPYPSSNPNIEPPRREFTATVDYNSGTAQFTLIERVFPLLLKPFTVIERKRIAPADLPAHIDERVSSLPHFIVE